MSKGSGFRLREGGYGMGMIRKGGEGWKKTWTDGFSRILGDGSIFG